MLNQSADEPNKESEMKLPLIENIRTVALGRSPSPHETPPFRITWDEEPANTMEPYTDLTEFRSSVEVFYRQHKPSDAKEWVRENAIRALSYHIYGPVSNELRGVLIDLQASGLPETHPAFDRIKAMISAMEGKPSGD